MLKFQRFDQNLICNLAINEVLVKQYISYVGSVFSIHPEIIKS